MWFTGLAKEDDEIKVVGLVILLAAGVVTALETVLEAAANAVSMADGLDCWMWRLGLRD